MRSSRLRVLGLSLLLIIVILAGWLFGIAPQLADASTANGERASVISQNITNEVKLRKLKDDYAGIEGIRNQLSLLKDSVPPSAAISTFVTELNTLANGQQVTVRSITVNDAKPYTPVAPAAPSTAHGTTSPPTTSPLTTSPRITTNNFIVIPVQFSVTGDYSKVLEFVHEVQVGSRLFLISNLSSTGATGGKVVAIPGRQSAPQAVAKVDATVGGYVYVLIDSSK